MELVTFDTLVNEASTVTAGQFIEQARSYIGVKYFPQGRERCGMDCGGLLLRVLNDLGISDLEVRGYSGYPAAEKFRGLLESVFMEVEDVRPGDIAACDYGRGVEHTAIVTKLTPKITVVHVTRRFGVSEHYLYGRHLRAWTATYRLRHLVK